VLLVDGKSEDGIVVAENVSGAVALMNVGVHDDSVLDEFIALQAADSDGDVVYRAEAFAVIGVGVVKAAGEVAGEAVAERELSGEDCAACGKPDGFG
jgi:hypothetical protein